MSTVAKLLSQRIKLQQISDSAALDTELLLCHCLGKNRSYLRGWPEAEVAVGLEQQFLALMDRRQRGEPIAYLVGSGGFWSLDLQVSPATLIPRPETELLVEKTLSLMSAYSQAKLLDLGTGSGAIALAIASENPGWSVTACDVQSDAVQLAEKNRQSLSLNNVSICQSDWFAAIESQRFDCIVSNPPYIDPVDPHLNQGDVRFEPRTALVADNHGLADLEKIIIDSRDYLKDSAWLLLEHGYKQAGDVQALLADAGFEQIFTEQDLAGLDRVSGGQWSVADE